jgi:hypothetical protein
MSKIPGLLLKIRRRLFKLPRCLGYHTYSPNGDGFDCDYEYAEDCGDCLANFLQWGGTFNPETGKKMPFWLACLLYGKPNFDEEDE